MLSVFIKTLILYIILTFAMKIMGKRRIGELEPDELVSTLLVSEIAAMPISDASMPLLNSVIPILFIVSLEVLLAAIKNKSRGAKHILEGEPTYIIYKGRLFPDVLAQNRISISEILSEIRQQGIASLDDIELGILEANGKLSLIKSDVKISRNIIVDGEVHQNELRLAGKEASWLESTLKAANTTAEGILLLTVDEDGKVTIIKKEKA